MLEIERKKEWSEKKYDWEIERIIEIKEKERMVNSWRLTDKE